MRQRKVKNEEEKLAGHHRYLVQDPDRLKGRWGELFGNDNDIYIEVGCGKGKFILTLAEQNPDKNYIAVEGRGSIILRALEKASCKELKNIVFLKEYVKNIEDYFAEGELSGIYLNFSDPWPKDRHAKRRLTHSRYLEGYKKVLKNGHCIEFKTDNDELFSFALEEFQQGGMEILECAEDLHGTNLEARLVTTEYEDKFRKDGKPIHYCKVQ
ncbi:tRNA (guanosine(46)-N7)-methyltransferase TrmB [Sinanaerobacter chloroacetimidivorans]|jgi:tRNA (guanine-N7-)-methyltransferase|uniref:tRNA (guanine-N(7)-)-methyltransferase n=1 Tax=Sinanaerobacter chloroacetimidivorans TaxID=2818044 RepID=A0A8J7VY31_9FIRM|nr:tRNA (guanosine(46)-N7)-methyltransferase TrmB [Sinanaerobacter chloroacetimidivorans]MBR0597212.1 tRNA (guanosine(46)-N7)-methyltransferase TrmB [Sinanaerobacter chloroacetimidivorans]